jgi:CheY-like chemotaxis protein
MLGPIEVLLVEDNAGDTLPIRESLVDFPVTVNIHVARDGQQALTILADSQAVFNLIILDLNLPKLSGIEVLERVGHVQLCPIVVFSSTLNEVEIRRALELGASDHVQKPMDIESFMGAVVGMVQKWAGPKTDGAICGT